MNKIQKLMKEHEQIARDAGYLTALIDVMDLINSGKTGRELVKDILELKKKA